MQLLNVFELQNILVISQMGFYFHALKASVQQCLVLFAVGAAVGFSY